MHLKLVLISISKQLFPLSTSLPLSFPSLRLFSFSVMHQKTGSFCHHTSRHRQIPTLQIWWHSRAQEESYFCEVIIQIYVPLAYAGSEISDQLYFICFTFSTFPSAYRRTLKDTCGGLITNGLANIKMLLNIIVTSWLFLSCISRCPNSTLVPD